MGISAAFLTGQQRNDMPVVQAWLQTVSGIRIYAKQFPRDAEIGFSGAVYKADGSVIADGSAQAGGGLQLLDRGARLMSAPPIRETLIAEKGLIIGSLTVNEIQNMSISLNNADEWFSAIFSGETFLNAELTVKLGFRGLRAAEFLPMFAGRVVKEQLADGLLELEAAAI